MRNYDLSPLLRQWIGFDKLASALQTAGESQSFPPYNIEKSDDMAAPGVGEPGLQPELHPRRQHGGLWRDLHQWPAAYRSDPQ